MCKNLFYTSPAATALKLRLSVYFDVSILEAGSMTINYPNRHAFQNNFKKFKAFIVYLHLISNVVFVKEKLRYKFID